MSNITNIVLHEIFKSSKKSKFDKQPDFDKVVEQVSSKLNVPVGEQLKNDIEICFKEYQQQSNKNRELTSSSRQIEEKVVVLERRRRAGDGIPNG